MSREVVGVPLLRLEAPIRMALASYQEIADSGLVFDADAACRLEPTLDKPNSARSETNAAFRGDLIGKLFVIAFKPGDGTGSEVSYKLEDLQVEDPYPRETKVVPRSKEGVHSEAHLTIVRHRLEDPHAEPELFEGTYDLLTKEDSRVRKTHELGHPVGKHIIAPITTLTVGYNNNERFGDPHTVYSGISDSLQVCAFLAITNEVNRIHPNILDGLNPQLPRKV